MDSSDTKVKIIKAMKSVIKDKSFDKITIGDITEAAGISRQTFYYHFDSIFEAYKWAIAAHTKHRCAKSNDGVPSLLEFALAWARALERQKALTIAVLKSSYCTEFREYYTAKNNEISIQFVRGMIGGNVSNDVLEMTALFLSHAYTGLIIDWIGKDMEIPLMSIQETIMQLMSAVLKPEIFNNVIGNWKK